MSWSTSGKAVVTKVTNDDPNTDGPSHIAKVDIEYTAPVKYFSGPLWESIAFGVVCTLLVEAIAICIYLIHKN